MPKWTLDETIAYAKSQIGQTNGKVYAKIAVGWESPYDWCAYFDSTIKIKGQLDCPYFPNGFAFDKRDLGVIGDRWVEPRDLQAGDFIGFDWDGGGQYGGDHVGYVVQRVAAGDYWTVEGNCGGEVRLKHRTIENTRSYYSDGSLKGMGIIGGIRPYYSTPKKEDEVYSFKTIQRGAHGNEVMLLQSALNIRQNSGFALDASFGPYTESEVKRWQRNHGLYADGICGPKTWPTVLGN